MTTISKGFIKKLNEDLDVLRREYENAKKEYDKILIWDEEGWEDANYEPVADGLLEKINIFLRRYGK
jgi:hypothetical protein